jgi:hypothetical protein
MKRKINKIDLWLIIPFLYPLFIPRTWKLFYAPQVNGISGSNELYIIVIYVFIKLCVTFFRANSAKIKVSHPVIPYTFFLIYVLLTSFIVMDTISAQSVYAMTLLLLPMSMIVLPQKNRESQCYSFIRLVAFISILYSMLGIYTSLITEQTRINLPLGVSTTVVFFYISVLPIVNLASKLVGNRITKLFLRVGFWLVALATLLTLSRAGTAVMFIVVAWCMFDNIKKKQIHKGIFGGVVLVSVIIFISSYLDLSRLFIGFSDDSSFERFRALLLGLQIFKNNFLLGVGNGMYFTRLYTFEIWTDKLISAYGMIGLLDPHNAYVLILSENGIIGMLLLGWFFKSIYMRIKSISNIPVQTAGKQFFFSVMVYSFTSSDIFTMFGLSSILWIILGMFVSYSYRKPSTDEI